MEYSEGYYMGINWICCPMTMGGTRALKVKILADQYQELYITDQQIKAAGSDYVVLIHLHIEQQTLNLTACPQ